MQDKFAEVVIKKFIMPSISPENCLLYLTEVLGLPCLVVPQAEQ